MTTIGTVIAMIVVVTWAAVELIGLFDLARRV